MYTGMVAEPIAQSQRFHEPKSPRGRAGATRLAGHSAEVIVSSVGWGTAYALRAAANFRRLKRTKGSLDPRIARHRGHTMS